MKTTHLLTTWALSALFVACTADEFKVANPDNVSQDRAKVHPDFVLLTEDLQTRYAVEGGAGISFDFEKGDRLGAALVDEYKEGENPEDFNVTYNIQKGYCMDYQENGEWKPNAQLDAGHYLFVYPFNPENKVDNQIDYFGSNAVIYTFPSVQEMYYDRDRLHVLNAAIEKGNQAIGAAVLHEGEQVAEVGLKNLFTYPKMVIYFDSNEPVTSVSQIVLKAETAEPFLVKGEFDHRVVSDMFAGNYNGNLTGKDYWNEATQTVDWDKVGTYDFLSGRIVDEASNYIVVKFADNAKVGEDYVTKNKFVEARVMMPSIDNFGPELDNPAASTGIVMYVYTNNGVYRTPFQASSFDFKATTDKEKQQAALWRNHSNGLTLKPLTADNKTEDVEILVTNQEEWNNLVAMYGNSGVDQTVAIVGDEFVFNEETQWPTNCRFYLTTDVSVEGNVEIQNVSVVEIGTDGNLVTTIKEGATLILNNTFEAIQVNNHGTLLANASVSTRSEGYYDGIYFVSNRNRMDIYEGAKVQFSRLETTTDAVTNNYGEISGNIYNYGTINNYGVMRISGANVYQNDGVGWIYNAQNAEIWMQYYFGNSSNIINEGTMTCVDPENGPALNNGYITSCIGATTFVTENNGQIIVYSADAAGLTVLNTGEFGRVTYTATQPVEDFTNSLVDEVTFEEDYTILGGEINFLDFRGSEATLTLNNPEDPSAEGCKVEDLRIVRGKLTLGSDATFESLTVWGELIIPEGVTLTCNGFPEYFVNSGRIVVRGTLIAPNIMEGGFNGDGTIDVEGGEVIWGNQSEESAE